MTTYKNAVSVQALEELAARWQSNTEAAPAAPEGTEGEWIDRGMRAARDRCTEDLHLLIKLLARPSLP